MGLAIERDGFVGVTDLPSMIHGAATQADQVGVMGGIGDLGRTPRTPVNRSYFRRPATDLTSLRLASYGFAPSRLVTSHSHLSGTFGHLVPANVNLERSAYDCSIEVRSLAQH